MGSQDEGAVEDVIRADYAAAQEAYAQAIQETAIDVLSSSARGERDRLFAASAVALALVSAAQLPKEYEFGFKVALSEWWAFPAGLAAVLLYFLASFGLIAWTDWLRWRATLRLAVARTAKWHQTLSDHLNAANRSANEIGQTTLSRFKEFGQKRAELDATIKRLEGLLERATDFDARQRAYARIEEENDRHRRLIEEYDLRDLRAQTDTYAAQVHLAFEAIERLFSHIRRWRVLASAHATVSIAVPLAVGGMAFLMLSSLLVRGRGLFG